MSNEESVTYLEECYKKTNDKLLITIQKIIRSLIMLCCVTLILWASTTALFIWYLDQYDFSSTVTVDGKEGTALYQDGKGNVINNGQSGERNKQDQKR